MRKLITLLAALTLVAPLMFLGCSGDDGATGAQGPQGPQGPPGGPGTGVVADETCVLCHGAGKAENVTDVHRIGQTAGSMTVEIQSVEFGAPVGDNVPVTVNFTFAAKDSAGNDITSQIDLTKAATATQALPNNTDNLAYISFYLAKLVPGTAGSPNEWAGYLVNPGGSGSAPFRTAVKGGVDGAVFNYSAGVGSYKFRTSAVRVSDGYADNLVHRAAIQVSGVDITLFTSDPYFNAEGRRRPVENAWKDVVSNVGVQTAAPGAEYPVKNDVSVDACNKCHDPLAIHGGGRREYQMCQICHNAKLEDNDFDSHPAGGGYDNGNLVKLVHGVHRGWNLGSRGTNTQGPPRGIGNFTEVTYPQPINNCTTCHQGFTAAADNTYDNFKNRPSRVACGSCHSNPSEDPPFNSSFVSPPPAGMVLHTGDAQADDSGCVFCHSATKILGYHAAKDGAPPTPNNPTLAGNLKAVEYAINSVTVDNTNAAIVKFQIKIDNVVANLGNAGDNVARPAGFGPQTQPSFLLAYTLPQNGVAAPADYNNRNRIDSGAHATGYAGQPQSVNIVGLPITDNDNTWTTVKVANAFPAGAKMRAVALQGYFTQTNGIGTDNVARHTPAVQKAVTGDTVRRNVIKLGIKESGYDNVAGVLTPVGCTECHQAFEGHGGNRVNNVQVCVMCHNPNLTTSGRTLPDNAALPPELVTAYGSDPLKYPEVTNNFKELIHGIHAADMRVSPFIDIRNALPRAISFFDFSEVTYPGDLSHCTKCHVGTTYLNVQVPNALLTTEKITTGVDGETRAQIIGFRDSVPNDTDLVNSPTTSACGYCHDTNLARGHFAAQGGDIKTKRSDTLKQPPTLIPNVTP